MVCHLTIKQGKYKIKEVIETIDCPEGFKLKKVKLED
jgi:uncharacterized protein (UPF0179 family)